MHIITQKVYWKYCRFTEH